MKRYIIMKKYTEQEKYMKLALKEAEKARLKDEIPVGAILVKDGLIVSRGYNQRNSKQNATAHAEHIAIEKACKKLKSWRLEECELYVTLEPCPMCAGAIIQSRIPRVYFGAYDPKGGCFGSCINFNDIKGFNHYPEIQGGILEAECSSLLTTFFREKRKK